MNNEMINNPAGKKKWAKDKSRQSLKDEIQTSKKKKTLNFTNSQRGTK